MRYLAVAAALVMSLMALPVRAADARLSEIFSEWQTLRAPDTTAIRFTEGTRFLTQHPGWPDEKIIRLRTEAAALVERPKADIMRDFCANYPPISGRGMLACYAANAGDATRKTQWLKTGWLQGDFSESEERTILSTYGNKLSRAEHTNRMERLLYEAKVGAAKRMLPLVPAAQHPLYNARIAIISDAPKFMAKVNALPPAQRQNPGVLFDRIQWRVANNQADTIAELFTAAPRTVPYPDLWWPSRAIAVREALASRDFGTALAVLASHGAMKGEAMADALWLKGWIILEFRRDPATAYKEFFQLYKEVATPVSKARAAYWAGRAASKNNNPDIATQWFAKAARHPTVFYGQLAHATLTPNKPLLLPPNPSFSADAKARFEREELVGMTRQLATEDDAPMLKRFLNHLASNATTAERAALVAHLADEIASISDRLRVAKAALRQGVVMLEAGWPRVPLPPEGAVEDALALAIIRQESEFDPLARSSANASGLMQLLPSTARQVADKNDWPFNEETLDNPQENIRLGTHYLGQIIGGFDGSYILGIASYNAGPGNVRKWVAARGVPPKTVEGAVNWIEAIPFAETRNYVMRALENVQIYRALESPDAPSALPADLIR